MNKRIYLLLIVIITINSFISCKKENTNMANKCNNDTLFFDNFENMQISKNKWIFEDLAEIATEDTINHYLSVSSFTQRNMGHSYYESGNAYSLITGIESDKLIFKLSYKAFVNSDDGPTVFKLIQVKKDTVCEIINISEHVAGKWKNYQISGTIFNLRKEDTLRMVIVNMAGYNNGSYESGFDDILITKK